MRVEPSSLTALLALTSDAVSPDTLSNLNWPSVVVALLGSGGLLTLIKYVAQPFAEHLRAVREREAADRSDEQARRKTKHDAELEQTAVVTNLARSVPATLEKLTQEINARTEALVAQMRADGETMRAEMRTGFASMREAFTSTTRSVDANTSAVDALTGEIHSNTHETLSAIADKLGARKSSPAIEEPRSTGARPRLASTPR